MADTQKNFNKPKIALIDMTAECEAELQHGGFNVSVGTFGTRVDVESSDRYYVVPKNSKLPNIEEQEIVFVNVRAGRSIQHSLARSAGHGVSDVFQKAEHGVIDPRPLFMMNHTGNFNRILAHSGILIVFLSAKYELEYKLGASYGSGNLIEHQSIVANNWSFCSALHDLNYSDSRGTEIKYNSEIGPLASLLQKGAEHSQYTCTFNPGYNQRESFTELARNKFGNVVAGMIEKESPGPLIIMLPQMPKVHLIIRELVEKWCLGWRPQLFPHHDGQKWLHLKEYEIPSIVNKQERIDGIIARANLEITQIRGEIDEIRSEKKDWYALLNGTDDDLVQAVINTLKSFGFIDVVDMDAEHQSQQKKGSLREDIQIRDTKPVLVVDVKGIAGCPDDGEATQASKHATMRTYETGEIHRALSIINHERHLPPHKRNPNPYREEIIGTAIQTGLGLMTTWDLFRLHRNKEMLGWTNENIKPMFYRTGRIDIIPQHYTQIGDIGEVWNPAICIIPNQNIQINDRIAIRMGDYFEEIVITSLQIEGDDVQEVLAGTLGGIAVVDARKFREGMQVFLVQLPE